MSKKKPPYYGITDSNIEALPVSPEDLEFIKTSLNFLDSRESWASLHDSKQINEEQGARLAGNLIEAQQTLMDALLLRRLGRMPPDDVRARSLKMRGKEGSVVRWFYWRSKLIAMATAPISYVQHGRYFLRWYWKEID